jgi:hypothetical protein
MQASAWGHLCDATIIEDTGEMKAIVALIFFILLASWTLGHAGFDEFGGFTGMKGTETGLFHTEKLGDQWWLITPKGNVFFSLSVSVVATEGKWDRDGYTYRENIDRKYAKPGLLPDRFRTAKDRWAYYVRNKLSAWGFNHTGTFSHPPVTASMIQDKFIPPPMGGLPANQMPQVITHRAGSNAMSAKNSYKVKNLYASLQDRGGFGNARFPDVFDPQFETAARDSANRTFKASPWIVYIFMDQTDEMRGVESTHPHLGFVAMAAAPNLSQDQHGKRDAITYTDTKLYSKYAARDFLRSKYGTLARLNQSWGTSYTSWESDGGWGMGSGVLDENGDHLGDWKADDAQKEGFPAVREDLDAFATTIMRQWYRTVYRAFKQHAKIPYPLVSNNMRRPKTHVYEGMRSEDGTEVYVDVVNVRSDPAAGRWSDILNRPFTADNLGGYFTAENDSPMGYVGTVDAFAVDSTNRSITITCNTCDFYWAGHPNFKPVHTFYTTFSSLPAEIVRNNGKQHAPQYFRTKPHQFLSKTQFVIGQASYAHGALKELKAAMRVGDTFRRVQHFNRDGPFATQEDRGRAYCKQLLEAAQERSPKGVLFRVGASLWEYKDKPMINKFESYNFGLVTMKDNAYDGKEAVFSPGIDQYGFPRHPEHRVPHISGDGFGDFLSFVVEANHQIYRVRTGSAARIPAAKSSGKCHHASRR